MFQKSWGMDRKENPCNLFSKKEKKVLDKRYLRGYNKRVLFEPPV